MKWEDVSKETRDTLDGLGSYSPTYGEQLKGYKDRKTYLDVSDLYKIARACLEAAAWLSERGTRSKCKKCGQDFVIYKDWGTEFFNHSGPFCYECQGKMEEQIAESNKQ